MDPLDVWKIQKKRSKVEKSYLDISDRSKNLLSVQNGFEIVCDNNRLPNQLLLSSEIDSFEDEPFENDEKSSKTFDFHWKSLLFVLRIL